MARPYLVAYDLRAPGRKYTRLHEVLKAQNGWWHHLESVWIVLSDRSADELFDLLRPHLDPNDRLFITALDPGKARQGWLPKDAWDWLDQHIG